MTVTAQAFTKVPYVTCFATYDELPYLAITTLALVVACLFIGLAIGSALERNYP